MMMEERSSSSDHQNGSEKMEEIMLPGFRFHPTDEELVGFYLKKKIQQRPLSIELIRQLDIYKYDPWDLPKLATAGEKEWYFYCPRDRKYRNSARPNRVTGAGFWKATGTDRPIYSSEGSKCIGLKKSLVFYKGRAAKGIKTDWMMHEFRLPSLTVPSKRFIDQHIPANDSWAICRIFKKANSTAHRALSQSWVSPILPAETPNSSHDLFSPLVQCQSTSHNFMSTSAIHEYGLTTTNSSSPLDDHIPCYKPFQLAASNSYNTPSQVSISSNEDLPNISYTFLPHEKTFDDDDDHDEPTNSSLDASSLLFNMSSSIFGDFGKSSETLDYGNGMQDQYSGCFSNIGLPLELMHENVGHGDEAAAAACLIKDPNEVHFDDQWGSTTTIRSSNNGWPFMSMPLSMPDNSWKSNFLCDSNSSEISTGFSTNKCYT